MTRAVHFIRETMRNLIQAMDCLLMLGCHYRNRTGRSEKMRLIDIDTTYPLLKERLTWLGQYGDDVYRLACECIRGVMETQPTAYDVDKVVKQLEEERDYSYVTFGEYAEEYGVDEEGDWHFEGLKRAIEIVKGGGVEK